MNWFDRLFIRRIDQPCYDAVPPRDRLHLGLACQQLSEAEQEVAKHLDLCTQPRLALVDEELAVIITPRLRAEIVQESRSAIKAE